MKTIPLTKGLFTIVDDEDFEILNQYKWYALNSSNKIYAARDIVVNRYKSTILLHRFLMNINDSKIHVDYKNGFSIDNTKQNLRLATNQQNMRNCKQNKGNKTGFRGVIWIQEKKKFRAGITINRKSYHLGYFLTAEEASKVYEAKAKEVYGEFYKPINER